MRVVVTGAAGLLGWHTAARLHAANCAAAFRCENEPFEIRLLDHRSFNDPRLLAKALDKADVVLHFAGVNRGTEDEVATGNQKIARTLADAVKVSGGRPHIVYANSSQSRLENPYGRGKREAAAILGETGTLTNLVLPHIFGECARPNYNNVTATLVDRLWRGEEPTIHEGASVELLHAGSAADLAIGAALNRKGEEQAPSGQLLSVSDLWDKLRGFHADYVSNVFPALDDPFDAALFNCYRTGGFPIHYPLPMTGREDERGVLFETSKAKSTSQTFVSSTVPGQIRGDHFHVSLVERFIVLAGKATIRVRRVLSEEVVEFRVSGDLPAAIDMPPLHTHHIENTGVGETVTFFFANRIFDPLNPDTYADPVLKKDKSL